MTNYSASDQLIASNPESETRNPGSGIVRFISDSASPPLKAHPRKKKRLAVPASQTLPEQTESTFALEQWRKKDNRIWSDEEAIEFPKTFFYNLHREEWSIKAEMADAVRNYLYHEAKSVYSVLEVGCGCGWFSNILSHFTKGSIIGIDQGASQIEQATRLFAKENLAFRRGDFFQTRLRKNSFDFIILIDSHQWQGSLDEITARAKTLLTPGGELHILSSSLPSNRTIQKQQEVFAQYCSDKLMGSVPQHLHWASKEDFFANGFEELNSPSFLNRMFNRKKTGTWMRLHAGKQ